MKRRLGTTFERRRAAVAAMAVVSLLPQVALGYRTGSDMPEFGSAGRITWQAHEIPILLSDAVSGPLVSTGVASVAEHAMASWDAIACSQPKLQPAGISYAPAAPGDGLNMVQWVKSHWTSYGFAPDAAAMTDVQYQQLPNGGWAIVEADLYLNAEQYDWVYGSSDVAGAQDLASVLRHEFGHVIGLLHPCELLVGSGAPLCASAPAFQQSVMYPIYQSGGASLGADDVAGVCYLYPVGSCPADGCPSDTICTANGCEPACGGKICTAEQTCVEGLCVAPPAPEPDAANGCGTRDAGACAVPKSGRAQLWDPCASEIECGGGLFCTADGYCNAYCTTDVVCGSLSNCGESGACVPGGGVFADKCQVPSDCSSNLCLVRESGPATCTRSCSAATADCPAGQSCEDLDGKGPICVPPKTDNSGCGCRMVGNTSPSNRNDFFSLLLASVIVGWWRRSKAIL